MPPQKIEAAHFSPDTREFIVLLHQHAVRYVIVGGEAVIFHGYAIHLLSLPSLLKNKDAAGRPKDLEDVRYLRRSAEERQR